MPSENFHDCRLKSPGKYIRFARKKCEQKHDGKCIDVTYGIFRKKGELTSEIQSLHYPVDVWTESAARKHCNSRDGILFEPAKKDQLVIKSDMQRLVYGEVYAPWEVDTHGEYMTPETVENMAHEFLMSGKVDRIDVQHNFRKSGILVVESFIAREGDPVWSEGSWVLGAKVTNDDLWQGILVGDYNGWSFAGPTMKQPERVVVEAAEIIVGTLEGAENDLVTWHDHDYFIKFDEEGKVLLGKSSQAFAHTHEIKHTVSTELALEHAHRIVLQ